MGREIRILILLILGLSLIGFFHPYVVLADNNSESADMLQESDEFVEEENYEDELDFEEDEAGFAEIEIDLDETESVSAGESHINIGGFFKEEIDYGHAYDEPDFSKIRSTLNLKLDLKLNDDWRAKIYWNGFYDYSYEYRGRDEFTDETLETHESEIEFRNVYIDGDFTDWFRIKFGRQFIVWGQSDSAQITDMANPRDTRELGMVDLEDARIPVGATKLSFLFGSIELNAVAIHEIRGNKIPGAGSEFDLYQGLRTMGFTIDEEEVPDSNGENTEYLVRLFKTFNGGDFGIMWADVFDDSAYFDFKELTISVQTSELDLTVVPRHKRIQTYGFSGVVVWDSWLFKTEIAEKLNKAVIRGDIEEQLTTALATAVATGMFHFDEDSGIIENWSEKNILQGMIGVEYSGIEDVTISFEAVAEQIEDYEENLLSDEVTGQMALIISHTALNNTLDSQLFWIHFTDNNGDVYRINVGYDLRDALNVSGGFIAYEAVEDEAMVYNYRNNDRVFFSLKYSF